MSKMIGQTNKSDAELYLESGYEGKIEYAKGHANRVKKHPEVQEKLVKFKDYLNAYIPPQERARKAAELFNCGDKRVEVTMFQELAKLNNDYPASKLKVQAFQDKIEEYREDG